MKRHSGRTSDQIRSIRITPRILDHVPGSVLFELGKTKVLCAVTLQKGVPPFLRGSGTGWLNAEYAMLPAATPTRNQREATASKRSGRSVEISRFISRTLRTIVNLAIGERTIVVDCDIIQADGGTRTAAISAAYAALVLAQADWLERGELEAPFLTGALAAVSVGVVNGVAIVDIDYQEDCSADADFNFVITKQDEVVEIQGGAEKRAVSWDQLETLCLLARKGIKDIRLSVEQTVAESMVQPHVQPKETGKPKIKSIQSKAKTTKPSLFSLQNRLNPESHESS